MRLRLTAVSLLVNHVCDLALVGDVHGLLLDGAAAVVEAFGLVHGALERIALPAKQVIGVGAVAAATLEAPYKRIRGT